MKHVLIVLIAFIFGWLANGWYAPQKAKTVSSEPSEHTVGDTRQTSLESSKHIAKTSSGGLKRIEFESNLNGGVSSERDFQETKRGHETKETLRAKYIASRDLHLKRQQIGFRRYLRSTYGLPTTIKSKEHINWLLQGLDNERFERLYSEFGKNLGQAKGDIARSEQQGKLTALKRSDAYMQKQKQERIYELVEVLSKRGAIELNKFNERAQ